jgi:hypothetical protein
VGEGTKAKEAAGALIPAGLSTSPVRADPSTGLGQATLRVSKPRYAQEPFNTSGLTGKKESQSLGGSVRSTAEAIARAAHRLNALREAWPNPPEWIDRVPEVVPLGLQTSPYPDCIVAKPGHEKDLTDRTLTKLYNQRPAWLAAAHQTLDLAVASAYGWADYSADMPDEEILRRLLALNLARTAPG